MSRPKFEGNVGRCVKCGAVARHRTDYTCGAAKTMSGISVDEHLRRTCANCGFEWEEACVDA